MPSHSICSLRFIERLSRYSLDALRKINKRFDLEVGTAIFLNFQLHRKNLNETKVVRTFIIINTFDEVNNTKKNCCCVWKNEKINWIQCTQSHYEMSAFRQCCQKQHTRWVRSIEKQSFVKLQLLRWKRKWWLNAGTRVRLDILASAIKSYHQNIFIHSFIRFAKKCMFNEIFNVLVESFCFSFSLIHELFLILSSKNQHRWYNDDIRLPVKMAKPLLSTKGNQIFGGARIPNRIFGGIAISQKRRCQFNILQNCFVISGIRFLAKPLKIAELFCRTTKLR